MVIDSRVLIGAFPAPPRRVVRRRGGVENVGLRFVSIIMIGVMLMFWLSVVRDVLLYAVGEVVSGRVTATHYERKVRDMNYEYFVGGQRMVWGQEVSSAEMKRYAVGAVV